MEQVLLQAVMDFGIYSLLVVIYATVGAYQNINIFNMKFDWRIYVNGLVRWLVLGFGVIGTVFASFLLLNQAHAQGIEIVNAQAVAPRVILAVVMLASAHMIGKIVAKLGIRLGLKEDELKRLQESSVNTDGDKPLVFKLEELPMPSEDYIAAKRRDEIVGGIGAHYSVPTGTYDLFRGAVLGRGFDIDNHYGWQCWDGAALLWQQFGRQLVTGNGLAIGCWDIARNQNAGAEFTLVTDVNSLRRGDVVVMRPNHIGFFDGYDGAHMLILGQNQGGSPGPSGGAAFNVVRIHKGSFAGAFRLKKWATPSPAPAPAPAPAPQPARKSNEEVAREVMRGDWGNGDERKRRLEAAGYSYAAVQGIVNSQVPAPAPQPVAPRFSVGDTVVPTALVDYNGTRLTQYDDTYTITEINGSRAVLSARGQVWAAMNTGNIRKV